MDTTTDILCLNKISRGLFSSLCLSILRPKSNITEREIDFQLGYCIKQRIYIKSLKSYKNSNSKLF